MNIKTGFQIYRMTRANDNKPAQEQIEDAYRAGAKFMLTVFVELSDTSNYTDEQAENILDGILSETDQLPKKRH